MRNYYKYNTKTKESKTLYAQDLCVQKPERVHLRLNSELKNLIEKECTIKDMTITGFFTNLAIWYFEKIGKVKNYKKKTLIEGIDWELE